MLDKFFARQMTFEFGDEAELIVLDILHDEPRIVKMESWPTLVFESADGLHTVGEFVQRVAACYEGDLPDDFEQRLCSIVKELSDELVIRLSDIPIELPFYLRAPQSQFDPEQLQAEMALDGYPDRYRP